MPNPVADQGTRPVNHCSQQLIISKYNAVIQAIKDSTKLNLSRFSKKIPVD